MLGLRLICGRGGDPNLYGDLYCFDYLGSIFMVVMGKHDPILQLFNFGANTSAFIIVSYPSSFGEGYFNSTDSCF